MVNTNFEGRCRLLPGRRRLRVVTGDPHVLLLISVARAVGRSLDAGNPKRRELQAVRCRATSGEDVHHACRGFVLVFGRYQIALQDLNELCWFETVRVD